MLWSRDEEGPADAEALEATGTATKKKKVKEAPPPPVRADPGTGIRAQTRVAAEALPPVAVTSCYRCGKRP